MNFGEKLKIVRKALNLTQQELADRLGVTKQAISRYENSERDPNLRTAKDFSEKLGIDLTILSDDDLYLPTPDKIRSERLTRGWSLSYLSSLLRISEDRLSALENGESFPTVLELAALSKILSYSSDSLLGLSWDPELPSYHLKQEEHELVRAYKIASLKDKNVARIALGLDWLSPLKKNSGQGNIINLSDYIKRSLE